MQEATDYSVKVVPWLERQYQLIVEQAENNRLPHAMLLGGEKFQGKTALARSIANYLLCRQPDHGKVCTTCKGCQLVHAGSHPDLRIVEPVESRFIVVSTIRELVSWANQTAQQGGYKVVIIKPAEAMNGAAANALLKCLEEPVPDTVMLLVSDCPGRLLATIRSRCQRLLIHNPDREQAESYLMARIPDAGDVPLLLDMSGGRPLKALEMHAEGRLGQHNLLLQILQKLGGREMLAHEGVRQLSGIDPEQVLEMLCSWLIDMIKKVQLKPGNTNKNNELYSIFNQIYETRGPGEIYRYYDLVSDQWKALLSASNPNKTLVVEYVLVEFSNLTGMQAV